jgi:methionyl aminopeptidase
MKAAVGQVVRRLPPACVPSYAFDGAPSAMEKHVLSERRDPLFLSKMRHSCRLAKEALNLAGSLVIPGATGVAINEQIQDFIISKRAYPSPINYMKFPAAICVSVNNEWCHGIPSPRPFAHGDVVKIDVSVYVDGVHGDCCGTFFAGTPSPRGPPPPLTRNPSAQKLLDATQLCLNSAMAVCGPGQKLSLIGRVIEATARGGGYSVAPIYSGHGIGRHLHMLPFIHHTGLGGGLAVVGEGMSMGGGAWLRQQRATKSRMRRRWWRGRRSR